MPRLRSLVSCLVAAVLAAAAAAAPPLCGGAPRQGPAPSAASPAPASAQAPRQPRMSAEWKRVPSEHFTIVGTSSPEHLAELAVELEAFLAVVQQMTPSLKEVSPVPTYVVALKDRGAYNAFQLRNAKGRREKWVTGYFMAVPDGAFMVMPWGGKDEGSLRVVLHEFAHYLSIRGVSRLPLWVSEGVAEFYSTFHIDKSRDMAVVGEPPRDRLPAIYVLPLLPLERLTTVVNASEFAGSPDILNLFYAQSWALVHYLFVGNKGARTRQIGAYVRALDRGESRAAAFTSAFGGSYEDLRKELFAYVKASQFPYLRLKPGTAGGMAPDASRVGPIPQGEADALQAMIYARIGARAEAEAAYAKAQADPPSGLQARIALDRVRVELGLTADAVAKYDALAAMVKESAAGKPLDAATQVHLSLAALAAGRIAESDAALEAAAALVPNPDFYRRRAYAAFALSNDAVTAKDVRAFFRRPVWQSDSAPYVAFLGALAMRRLGQDDEAASLLARAATAVLEGTWTAKLVDYLRGALPAPALLDAAKEDGERTEAHAYIGFDDVRAGRSDAAIKHFRWVKEKGSRNFVEYPIAVAELKRLGGSGPK